jgi:hypothetical protein
VGARAQAGRGGANANFTAEGDNFAGAFKMHGIEYLANAPIDHVDQANKSVFTAMGAYRAKRSLWATLHMPNKTLSVVVGLALALLLAELCTPWAAGALRFAPLPAHELAAACALGLLSAVWFEGSKWTQRRRQGRGSTSGTPPSATESRSIA